MNVSITQLNLAELREEYERSQWALALEPDWTTPCEVCGAFPTVPLTGMCSPCTFGEADTAGGNW